VRAYQIELTLNDAVPLTSDWQSIKIGRLLRKLIVTGKL
jgi:hypothetical protein